MSVVVANNPIGAFGYNSTPANAADFATLVRDLQTRMGTIEWPCKALAAVTAGDVVAFTTSVGSEGQIITNLTNGNLHLQHGVAKEDIAAGGVGNIIVKGPAKVNSAAAVALYDRLIRSVTTAGRVAVSATPAIFEFIGWAVTSTAAAGQVVMFVQFPGAA